ncbi:hypothetical protein [Limosilactobacillus sp.]
MEITDEAFVTLVQAYTHEAGVRNLEREIANAPFPRFPGY